MYYNFFKMSLNLVNVFADLQRRYGENLIISYGSVPSYLAAIAGNLGKIIFLHEGNRNQENVVDFISPTKLHINGNIGNLDLTGSPLKDDCVVEAIAELSMNNFHQMCNPWKLEEQCHKAMTLDRARDILCHQNFQQSNNANNDVIGSIWALCNNSGIRNPLLLQNEIGTDYFSRGIITYLGVSLVNAINIQSLLKQHLVNIGHKLLVETNIENTYRINWQMLLRCSWSTANALPSLVDLSPTCDVLLLQTFNARECGILTQNLFNQLRILSLIREDIIHFKEAERNNLGKEAIYQCGCGIDMEELRESIYKVMTEICAQIETTNELESDLETVVQRTEVRRLCDLTDKLWEMFKRCSSYKDLKYAFNILFQCAARCTIVNTPTNNNRLASIISEISNKRLAIPCLTGSEPLELLLEIGLEKLFKDYEYIFTESKICSGQHLKPQRNEKNNVENSVPNLRKSLRFALPSEISKNSCNNTRKTFLHNKNNNRNSNVDESGFKNSNFNEFETAQCLARLYQIHCTLEHLLKIHIHLNLSNDVYADVCKQLLGTTAPIITSIDETLKDEREISISAHEVREYLNEKTPYSRRITMKSRNKLREVKTTFYYNMDNIFPPLIAQNFPVNDQVNSKETLYYGWLYRTFITFK